MFKKGTKLYSILFNKCPRCNEGDFLEEKNILKINKAFKVKEHCPNCGLKYMREPSFFYGAMYVNYGLSVGVAIITFIISYLGFGLTLKQSFLPIILAIIATSPFAVRWSRIIWINIFIHFDAKYQKGSDND
jgi:uncharacterized protein (DUF983 family)